MDMMNYAPYVIPPASCQSRKLTSWTSYDYGPPWVSKPLFTAEEVVQRKAQIEAICGPCLAVTDPDQFKRKLAIVRARAIREREEREAGERNGGPST